MSEEYDLLINRIQKQDQRIEKLELQIKNSPSNFNLHNMIKDLKGEISELRHDFNSHASLIVELRKYSDNNYNILIDLKQQLKQLDTRAEK